MLKRILVALDPDQNTPIATRYAKELAARHGAKVSGLAVMDTKSISREVGPGGAVGAMYYAEKLREQITAESRHAAAALVDAFEQELDRDLLDHSEQVHEGVPAKRIVEDMKYHDLLIIGRTPHFFYPNPEKKTHTLAQIVKTAVAPTLVVPDSYRTVKRVLIAYDGSDPSARTMLQFAQLRPFGVDLEVDIVHVRTGTGREGERESELILMLAAEYVRSHDFSRVTESSLRADEPPQCLLAHARSAGADVLVLGAHSVSAVRRLAFGSTTHHLMRECEIPFFLYH